MGLDEQQQQRAEGNHSNARQTLVQAGLMPPERKEGEEKRLLVYLLMWAMPATYQKGLD